MSLDSTLPSSLQATLQDLVARINNAGGSLRVVLIATLEGVPLGRVYGESPINSQALALLESVSAHTPVLDRGNLDMVMAIYDHAIVMHVYMRAVVSRSKRELVK
jgi:hypothetical protein